MSPPPVVGVLALQGDVREHLHALRGAGVRAVLVRRPEELAAVAGLVLPGGESTTIGRLAGAFGMLEPLRRAVLDGLPVFGSCAGMILLADRLLDGKPGQPLVGGLDAVVRRNAFGRQVDSFEGRVSMPAVGAEPVHAVFIRAPWVEEAGDGVEVLGRVQAAGLRRIAADGEPATDQLRQVIGRIVAVRQGNLLATAFHPELTGDARVHRLFVDMVRAREEAG